MLTNTDLLTYKSEDVNENPTESINFKLCNGVKSADDETAQQNSFRIDCAGDFFYFYAESEGEKDIWIGLISKQIISPNAKLIKEKNSESSSDDNED